MIIVNKNGFTLIELLVVISIIGILAAIILASLGDSKLRANESKYQAEARSRLTSIAGCDYGALDEDCRFSDQTCTQLGWSSGSGNINGDDVFADCAESDGAVLVSCSSLKTWKEAYDICDSVGSRLCTLNEIEQGMGVGTGCSFDSSMVWTMSPCSGGFWITKGSVSVPETNKFCQQDIYNTVSEGGHTTGTDMAVRCCADNAV